jgi:sulfate adenylyltransferase
MNFEGYPNIILDTRMLSDYEMLHLGAFHPLKGFMTSEEYHSVVDRMRFPDGKLWPIPIVLPIAEKWIIDNSQNLTYVTLKDIYGTPLAIMKVESIYKPNIILECQKVYRATYREGDQEKIDENHPYAQILLEYERSGLDYRIGGPLIVHKDVPHYDFLKLRHRPDELRKLFKDRNIRNVIAFQTRNPLHYSHIHLTKMALAEVEKDGTEAHLLIHPIVGVTQDEDLPYTIRVKCYQEILQEYPPGKVTLSLLPLSMHMAGPREALLHALVRKNYGATHFIVGRDHAGPSRPNHRGQKFYDAYEAQKLVEQYASEIPIIPIFSKSIVFTVKINNDIQNMMEPVNGTYKPEDQINSYQEYIHEISGTKLRKVLYDGEEIPAWFSPPGVIKCLRDYYARPKGIVFYMIGIPASGKTTMACALQAHLLETTNRTISLLDADIICQNLGFSRQDHSINVRRIGFIATEIAKHGGICIVANIAPYQEDRIYNRILINKYGLYLEIWVRTSLETCSARDPKGLYRLAQSGQIKLTGYNDDFETPTPDIIVDGTHDVSDNINIILKYLTDHQIRI